MIKEIPVHKAMVAFRVVFWQADIFIHIEGHNMFEANLARFVHFNQGFIRRQRSTAGWQAKNERTIGGRLEGINAVNDMASGPFTDLFSSCQGNQSHCSPQELK